MSSNPKRAERTQVAFPKDSIAEYHIFRRGLGLAPATLALDRYTLDPFERAYPEWWQSPRASFVRYLEAARAPWTRATRIRVFRTLVAFLHDEGLVPLDENPLRGVRAPIPQKRAEGTNTESIRAFLSVLGASWPHRRLRAAVLILSETGLRRGELCALTWGDVDMGTRTLRVRAETSKTRRERSVPFSPAAGRELDTLRAENQKRFPRDTSNAVLLGADGNPLPPEALGRQVLRIAKQHGLSFHLHGLRHHAATEIIRATGSLAIAARMLGHTKIATTAAFYEHLTEDDVRAAQERAGTLRSLKAARHV